MSDIVAKIILQKESNKTDNVCQKLQKQIRRAFTSEYGSWVKLVPILDATGKTEMGIEIVTCANSESMLIIVTMNLCHDCDGHTTCYPGIPQLMPPHCGAI